ncbi:MAG TPA: DUF2442 domain-containing protein [Rhizobiaceae bacterium]|nr:DUF2442 domain-containing protein [Rhizobiaceae bacterium]
MEKAYAGQVAAAFENDEVRPVKAWCDEKCLCVELADGRTIFTPLRWYPFVRDACPADQAVIELLYCGVWWPVMDEGISVKSMLLGWKAPAAERPQRLSRPVKL